MFFFLTLIIISATPTISSFSRMNSQFMSMLVTEEEGVPAHSFTLAFWVITATSDLSETIRPQHAKREQTCVCAGFMAEQGRLFSPQLSNRGALSLEGTRVKELRIVAESGLLKPSGESDQRSYQCTGLPHC